MTSFSVFFKHIKIGTTNLELGDPPMGVAFGQLLVTKEYEPYMAHIEHQKFLSVLCEDGTNVTGQGGIVINDLSDEMAPEEIEIEILGISYPLYGQLFPHHVAAYENQFKDDAQ